MHSQNHWGRENEFYYLGIIDKNSIGILVSLSFSIEDYALSSYNTTKISR